MPQLTDLIKKRPILWVIALQLLLVLIGFHSLWQQPLNYILVNCGDGMKNLFNLQAYVSDPVYHNNFFFIRQFNYPWGEYVNTTDNTPGFAIAFKWFCRHIADISVYAVPIFESLTVLSIIFTAIFTHKIFYRLLQNEWIALLMALVLPWVNPQTIRIPRGHFNLAWAFFIVWAIWAFIRWVDLRAQNNKGAYRQGISMVSCMVLGFLFHGYYIAILGLFIGGLLFFYTIQQIRLKGEWKSHAVATILIPMAALLLCGLYMKISDPFLAQRPDAPGGYDWIEQKVRFWSLFTSPKFYSFQFWIQNNEVHWDPENMGYLGHMALYGFTFIGLALLFQKKYRRTFWDIQKRYFADPLLAAIFWAGLMLLFVNFGEYYYPQSSGERGITFHNLLNPLLWLHLFTDQVEQFRSLGRFQWPFFWTFSIWAIYTLQHFLQTDTTKRLQWLWIPISLLGLLELSDYVLKSPLQPRLENPLHPQRVAALQLPDIDYSQYQAALILPYYYVGSELPALIVDDHEAVSYFSYQFYLNKRIPMLNTKLARTIPGQAQQISDWFHSLKPGPQLRHLLKKDPILVIRNKVIAADSITTHNQGASKTFMHDALYLPERAGLQAIDSAGDYVYYEWYPLR